MKKINTDHRLLRKAMTVADLIAELQRLPEDALVCFACDYGDICHTQQCLPVETVDEIGGDEYLEESAYSTSGIALATQDCDRDEDDQDEEETNECNVVILR